MTTFGQLKIGDEFIVFSWQDSVKMKIPPVKAIKDDNLYNTIYLGESEEYSKGAIVKYADNTEVYKLDD